MAYFTFCFKVKWVWNFRMQYFLQIFVWIQKNIKFFRETVYNIQYKQYLNSTYDTPLDLCVMRDCWIVNEVTLSFEW